jgi:signal transduction histidine kinase
MISQAFQHRSNRVIATSRSFLATFFLVAAAADNSQSAIVAIATYSLLAGYAAASFLYMFATWNRWWWECRLAGPAHVVDVLVFAFLLITGGYTSPFFSFFVFLIASSTMRWGWRETAATALALVTLFLASALTANTWGTPDFEVRQFIVRGGSLVILSIMLMWFDINIRAVTTQHRGTHELGDDDATGSVRTIIESAAAVFRAGRVVFAWWEAEEPWLNVAVLENGTFTERKYAPGTYEDLVNSDLDNEIFLFDLIKHRVLVRSEGYRRLIRCEAAVDHKFSVEYQIDTGMAICVPEQSMGGVLFMLDIPGLCSDDLEIAQAVAADIAEALQQWADLAVSEEAASNRARLSLAQDLHDSVLQFLAGSSFKVKGILNSLEAKTGVEQDLQDLQELQRQLSLEQDDLRSFIVQLRGGRGLHRAADICESLARLVDRLSRQWDIRCSFRSKQEKVEVPGRLQHDLNQLVREGIANAVRHGKAREVRVELHLEGNNLQLEISDNGTGFPAKKNYGENDERVGPWSLHERVKNLGGSLMLYSNTNGSRVSVTIPLAVTQ